MKLNKFLAYLTEAVDIDKLREKVDSDVPASVLDKLASKMKGNKYDNIAMAIIKTIQDYKSIDHDNDRYEYVKYLIDYPNVVYSALRKKAKNNSKFNAAETIKDSILFGPDMTNSSPKKYWYSIYTSETPKMEKEEFGLKNANVKELKQEYLIFPKTFKKTGHYGLSDNDLDKQWKDIHDLSAEIAKKDTSGEDGANDNHWCVASSDSNYYEEYKERGGTFVIVVKKKKDGSPDWNRRYLYYTRGYELGNNDDDEWQDEFADKFDEHLEPEDVLSAEAIKILENLSKKPSKVEKQNLAAEKRVYDAYEDYAKNSHKTNTPEWQAFRTLINTINKWIYKQNKAIKKEGYFTYGHFRNMLANFFKDNNIKTGKDLYDAIREGREGLPVFRTSVDGYDFQLSQEYNFMTHKPTWNFAIIADNRGNKEIIFRDWTENLDEIVKKLREEAGKTDKENEIIKELADKMLYNKASFGAQKKSFHPKSNYRPDKILKDNKAITRAYENLKNNMEYSINFLPCDIIVKKRKNRNDEFVIRGKGEGGWPHSTICDLLDPQMPKKITEYLDKYNVAVGPHSERF